MNVDRLAPASITLYDATVNRRIAFQKVDLEPEHVMEILGARSDVPYWEDRLYPVELMHSAEIFAS